MPQRGGSEAPTGSPGGAGGGTGAVTTGAPNGNVAPTLKKKSASSQSINGGYFVQPPQTTITLATLKYSLQVHPYLGKAV